MREVELDALEARLVKALASGDENDLRSIRREVSRLDSTRRADLRFRIDDGRVEFYFDGKYPFDQTNPELLEYIVSAASVKDHETLLSVDKDEMRRVEVLRPLFREECRLLVDARLWWPDGRHTRSVNLGDILHQLSADERAEFDKQLVVNDAGLGGSKNVKGDREVLPQEPTSAKVTLVFRLRN
jgi:hypothetical protein